MLATVLDHIEDLDNANPGLYVVRSGTTAYFPAKGLIEKGEAIQLGEFFDDDGNHVVTFELKKKQRGGTLGTFGTPPPIDAPRTIRIGSDFFISALKDYSDWQIKWWREAIQNGVDAGGIHIDLTVSKVDDGTFLIGCADDGKGMDEDTIINKFLVLGATTKTAEGGTAGGFGKAKELLLLPWIAWKIHSRDRVVEGSGIDYKISHAPYRQGTLLEVLMPADKTTSVAAGISFIEKCYLPNIHFTVNGQVYYASLKGENFVGEDPGKAEIYFIPSETVKQSYLYVRARGLFMFTSYIGEVPGYIVAEIIAPSIEILTANRDGFREWSTRSTIDSLAQRIAKDNLSALQNKRGMLRKKYLGSGKFKAKRLEGDLLEHIGPAQNKLSVGSMQSLLTIVGHAAAAQTETVTSLPSSALIDVMLDQKFVGAAHIEAAIKQLVWQPDFYLMNDIEGWKVPKKFFPETMTPRVYKLAKTWVELCRFVMMQLGSNVYFGVGFHFNKDTAASALTDKNKEGEEEQWLMINPFKDFHARTDIWSPSQDADLKWLYAAAVHECTHIADGLQYHDESFASALTKNMARTADGFRKIKQIVGEIRGRGGIESDE